MLLVTRKGEVVVEMINGTTVTLTPDTPIDVPEHHALELLADENIVAYEADAGARKKRRD